MDEAGIWVEQCWRDILQVTLGLENNKTAFNLLFSPSHPMGVTFACCQQFFLSRAMVRRRPLSVWKKLLHIVNEQTVCHEGVPDYDNLFAYHYYPVEVGPEPEVIQHDHDIDSYGRLTQGGAMEHLAHIIFGEGNELEMKLPRMKDICEQFESDCPFSPCFKQSLV
jgi:hypothetical protein